MENASKALIIAGAILLAILLISLGIMIYTSAQDTVSDSGMDRAAITSFNNQFLKYEGDIKGTMVKSNPEVLRREHEEGHYIANHSFTHVYSNIYSSPQAVLDEYNRTEIAIKNAIGDQTYNSRVKRCRK